MWMLSILILIFQSALSEPSIAGGIRGEEAPVSERSEFGAVPWFSEKRREPSRSDGSRLAERFFGYFLCAQRK